MYSFFVVSLSESVVVGSIWLLTGLLASDNGLGLKVAATLEKDLEEERRERKEQAGFEGFGKQKPNEGVVVASFCQGSMWLLHCSCCGS